ncbi:MAG TPA: spore coat protein [Desulfosporosinus sp.]|jgi:hypothetical protein|nr:spore coat protein [Desulfosporosinus sp.]
MSQFTDLDMLYDYEKDAASAAMGYSVLATRAHHSDLRSIYLRLSNEANNAHSKVSKLINSNGGIA